jgi:hypothetical protein
MGRQPTGLGGCILKIGAMTPWYPPTTPQAYYPSAGTGGFLLVAEADELILVNPPFMFTSGPEK